MVDMFLKRIYIMITSDITKELLDIPICLQFCVQLTDTVIYPKEWNIQIKQFSDPLKLLIISFFTIYTSDIICFSLYIHIQSR